MLRTYAVALFRAWGLTPRAQSLSFDHEEHPQSTSYIQPSLHSGRTERGISKKSIVCSL